MAIVAVFTFSSAAQPKYYKPHSVKWMNGWHSVMYLPNWKYYEEEEGRDMSKWLPDTTTFWTGDAVTVDGRECVEVWKEHKGETSFHCYIYEADNGYVYTSLENEKDGTLQWRFSCDFSKEDWQVGDSIRVLDDWGNVRDTRVHRMGYYKLDNGETTSWVESLFRNVNLIGIGDIAYRLMDPVFEEELSFLIGGCEYVPYTIAFWRDGVRLYHYDFPPQETWGPQPTFGGITITGVETQEVKADSPTYDLQGRPVAEPQHGIYIQNGKKVLKR